MAYLDTKGGKKADATTAPEDEIEDGGKDTEDADDIHAEALKRYERGYNHDRHNIDAAMDDLAFCDPENQWSTADRTLRVNRPILAIDKTGQFVRQITGDMRQMRPAIKVVPVDDSGDKEVAAKILPGLMRYIEQRSDAQAAYYNAADSQVRAGIGAWRILTEHANTSTFLQEIKVELIKDAVSIVWDPDAIQPTREDAQWCFVPVDMDTETFKERYPDCSADPLQGSAEAFYASWSTPQTVRIAEYFYKEPKTRRLARLTDGGVDDVTDDPEGEQAAIMAGATVEDRDDHKVMRCLISATELLEEPEELQGRYIPIVPVLGEEIVKGKETIRRGIVRSLKDVQRVYNYAISQQAEVIALQPKAPFLGTETNFKKYINQWESANSENWPFLEYTPDPANGNAAPSRVAPPVSSQGIDDLLRTASADMSAVTGIYPASLGAASNESSGKAILARQREGDTGSYLYIDNFGRALRYCGKILIDLIPYVYDTERTIRIVGEDGKVDLVRINQAALSPHDGMTEVTLNDVTVGAYDVAVEMGPSFSTKREEARDGMAAFMQAAGPEVAQIYIDLFAKMQDWPLADQIAKRAHMMLPPAIQQHEAQESGEPPPPQLPPPPPTPEQQMEMAKAQSDAQAAGRQQEIDRLNAEAALAKINNELLKTELALAQARAAPMDGIAPEQTTQPAGDPRTEDVVKTVSELGDMVMRIAQAVGLQKPPMSADEIAGNVGSIIDQHTQNLAQMHADHSNMLMQGMAELQRAVATPKRRVPVRDPKTQRILHVDEMPVPPGPTSGELH